MRGYGTSSKNFFRCRSLLTGSYPEIIDLHRPLSESRFLAHPGGRSNSNIFSSFVSDPAADIVNPPAITGLTQLCFRKLVLAGR
jgi:hypothetical protein